VDIQNQTKKAKELNLSGIEAAGSGDFEKAAAFFDEAAKIYESINDGINRALQLFSLAGCYHSLQKTVQAMDAYMDAYNLIKDNEKLVEYRAMILNNLGHLCVSIKNYDKALRSFEKACEIYETVKNENGQALQLQNIGSVHRDLNESKQALDAYLKSTAIFEKIENRLGEADQRTNIAYIYTMDNNVSEALKWYRKALGIYVDIHEDEKGRLTKKNIEQLEALYL